MPTTANNETLDRIKNEASEFANQNKYLPLNPKFVKEPFIAGAMYERDKAIDEAIEIVKAMQSGDKPIRYNQEILECYKKLEALKSSITDEKNIKLL